MRDTETLRLGIRMMDFDRLTHAVAAAPSIETSVALLLDGLAERIKATSNDQNIQKLSRELKGITPALVHAIARKPIPFTTD